MSIQPGERVLEVGVGTGINLDLYPRDAVITGIDYTASMLEKARERAAKREGTRARLLRWTPPISSSRKTSFDIVYAPYLISVVPTR
jgi:phosphatidylethanolamine/phosphatidyl-N-methylethanolamine N-methyltransferase